jgi:SAM-dependent methyltransferase
MSQWYKDWFASEEYLNVYQHRNNEDAQKLIDLILSEVKLPANSKILDAACGAGRHSIYLRQRGFDVVGFDLSKTLLQKAKLDSENKSIRIDLFCADLRRVYLNTKFNLIINLFTSFGYFDSDEENFFFPHVTYDLLLAGGYYILDYMNKNFVLENLIPESNKVINNKYIVEKRRIENNRVIKEIKIIDGDVQKQFTESVKLYNDNEIITQLKRIGFNVAKIVGDYEGNIFDNKNSQRLIIFCKR